MRVGIEYFVDTGGGIAPGWPWWVLDELRASFEVAGKVVLEKPGLEVFKQPLLMLLHRFRALDFSPGFLLRQPNRGVAATADCSPIRDEAAEILLELRSAVRALMDELMLVAVDFDEVEIIRCKHR